KVRILHHDLAQQALGNPILSGKRMKQEITDRPRRRRINLQQVWLLQEIISPLLRLLLLIVEQFFEADSRRIRQSFPSQAALGDVATILHPVEADLPNRFICAIDSSS